MTIHYSKKLAFMLAAGLLTVSCMKKSTPNAINDQSEKTLNESASQSVIEKKGVKAAETALSDAVLKESSLEGKNSGESIVFNISTNKVPARDFFLSLGENSQYNMVIHPDITGEISLNLREVSFEELVEILRKLYNYDIERVSNSIIVSPRALQTRIFQVNYLNLIRKGNSQLAVSASEVSKGGGGGNSSGSSVSTSFGEVNPWSEMEKVIHAIIGKEEGRTVTINANASLVIVNAMPDELRKVEKYLQRFQTNMLRQVVLEAKIIDVQLSDGFQAGIDWAMMARLEKSGSVQAGTGNGGLGNSGALIPGTGGQLFSTFTPTPFANPVASTFAMAVNFNEFQTFLRLLQTQGEAHVLSSPRVSTMSNQKAMIKIGTDAFYVTDVSIASTSSSSNSTSSSTQQNVSDVELTPFFSGIALDVTPQINSDGTVLLHIHPTISEVKEVSRTISFGTNPLALPLANSDLRESDSIVRAKNGQVVVIGGLMFNKITNNESSVPILGDIPVLGALFRHTETQRTKNELVILIRPVIVDEDSVWTDEIKKSADRMKSF